MTRPIHRLVLGGLLLLASLSVAVAQDADEYRKLFRAPETPLDFWTGLKFELDVGRPDLAAVYLRGLMALKPADKDLLPIVDRDGLTEVLRLRNVRQWTRQDKENKQALQDADQLVSQITEAMRKRLADPRMRELVSQLKASPEERDYAVRELHKAGALAVPYLVDAHLQATDPEDRLIVRQTLGKMGPDTLAPLLAALDSSSEFLKLDILDVLRRHFVRYQKEIVPHLWYLSAARSQPASVRAKATSLLTDFLETDASRLPPARVVLTREAERFHAHQFTFGDSQKVPVWRWDGKGLVQGWPGAATVTASQAEEYYGLRYARQALDLDPTYRPAQEVFLALAIDKATERGGPGTPLARSAPQVAELLARSNPELVIDLLDRAMKEKRTGVVLATVRSLADRAEVRSKRPLTRGEPVLVRALYYPDPRVRFAAAEGLLRLPGSPTPKTAARIVEILADALAPSAAYLPGRKVLVAISDEGWRGKVRQAVLDSGLQPVVVANDRDAMRQLRRTGEIEAILLASDLQGSLANLLAQVRQDVDVAGVPVLLAAVPTSPISRDAVNRYRDVKTRMDSLQNELRAFRTELSKINQAESKELYALEQELLRNRRMSSIEREAELRKTRDRYQEMRKELYALPQFLTAVRRLPEERQLQVLMDQEGERYDREARIREAALERFVSRYNNVQVVHTSLLSNSRSLEQALQTQVKEAGVALSDAEKTQAAERAIDLLAGLAEGNPPGYEVRPAVDRILDSLAAGRLSPEGQLAAVRAARLFYGPATQNTLAKVVLDNGRPAPIRAAAASGLIFNLQRQGILISPADLRALRELPAQAGLDRRVKEQVDNLIGALQPSDLATGQRLRSFDPAPVAPLPPPKK